MKVFIYEVGQVNGKLRANGLLLISGRLNDWHHTNYQRKFLMHVLGKSDMTTLAVTTTNSTGWVQTDPDGLTAQDEFIANARIEHQMQLMQLRPRVMFDIDHTLALCELPVVLSEKPGDAPRVFLAEFESHIVTIDELPEVADFALRELKHAEGDPLDILAVKHLKDATYLPLPSNTWLPCRLEDETDCVYRITSSSGRRSVLELWTLSNDVKITPGTNLISRYGREHFEIGRILSISEINTGLPSA